MKMGRMNRVPRVMTMREPIRAPKIWPTPMVRPAAQPTLPPGRKNASELTLLAKFMTFASPVARVMLKPSPSMNAIVQNVPVPGPKKPS